MDELCRLRRSEGYGVSSDEDAQERKCVTDQLASSASNKMALWATARKQVK